MALPGIFEPTIFAGRLTLQTSKYIRSMHPTSAVQPTRAAISKVLNAGWWGQLKIHGHRAQVHIAADSDRPLVYTRVGQPHKMRMPAEMEAEVIRLFQPKVGWNVIDAEWLKPEGRLFVFDFLKHNGVLLDTYTFAERYELLPRIYRSSRVETLPILKSVEACMQALQRREDWIEGLVFKAPATQGFLDSGIVRCRRLLTDS